MSHIYLDYAASAPVKPEVKLAVEPYLAQKFGNPSSIHFKGREARKAVDNARQKLAKFLNCQTQEIIFTSGGTEADNLAIKGVIQSTINNQQSAIKTPHVITSKIEHHAVLHTCQWLRDTNQAEVTFLEVDKNGLTDVEKVKKAIKPNTILISLMYANNEVGTIQPIREIGKIIEKENKNRFTKNLKPKSLKPILFHTDAVQAAGYLNCDTKYLHVDLLSLSGHKLGAPKGIGALFIKKGTPLEPLFHGGSHEYEMRAGTENVPGIVALGKAIELVQKNQSMEANRVKILRDYLEKQIFNKIPDVGLNGHQAQRLPHISNLNFKYVEGESILINLDLKGVAATTGSACTSGSLEPSHVIMAMDQDPLRAHGSIRFSLGWATTKKDLDYVIKVLPPIIKKLRKISPFGKK